MADQKQHSKKKCKIGSTLVYLNEPQVVLLDHGADAKIIGVAINKKGYDYPLP